tara:strand:+ start:2922 stop:3371 length:450 start_codon:yes stop_codon:yes gene_type:complete
MIRYSKYRILAALITALMGCSSLGGLGAMFGKKPSIEANVNVGKNVKQDKSQIKIEAGKTDQTADSISNDTSYQAKTITQMTQNIPPYIIILLVLGFGWLIPDPLQSYKGFKFLVYDVTQSFFVVPCKAVMRFFNIGHNNKTPKQDKEL